MTFVPTLNFNEKCREAMELYKKAFSGKITALMTYGYDGYEGTGGICQDKSEQELGLTEVKNTINRIKYIHQMEDKIKSNLNFED